VTSEVRCFGLTGFISEWRNGVQRRIVEGLPSHALPTGDSAAGPNDLSFQGRGGMFVTLGLGFAPDWRANFPSYGQLFGTLLQLPPSGPMRVVADVAAYERTDNPAGGPIDSNPYGLLAHPGGALVTDAGGNSLLSVSAAGQIRTVAVFPSRPQRSTDSVPTSVAIGPDGAYYVGELSGIPFATNAARIYRVTPGQAPQIFLTQLTTVIDLDFGPDGNLYVLQHSAGPTFFTGAGSLIRVQPDGTPTTVLGSLDRPTAVLVDSDGTIYVTNHGVTAGAGEVLKVVP
jgi:sugar lactone lactonase YvrE